MVLLLVPFFAKSQVPFFNLDSTYKAKAIETGTLLVKGNAYFPTLANPDSALFAQFDASGKLVNRKVVSGNLPRMTTAQRNALVNPEEGKQIYNLTTHTIDFFNGTFWKTLAIVDNPGDTVRPPGLSLRTFQINTDIENETVADLRSVLANYTYGKTISIEQVPIGSRTGQEFYISADADIVNLRYTCEQSLQNAVYTYIDLLNIHWYGSGDNWLFKPVTLNTVSIAGEWKAPTFRNRQFFGTGGLELNGFAPDLNNEYKTKWFDWKRRNRFNGDFNDRGHQGMAFYSENTAVCDANPQWFNGETGKRNGRIRIEIPEAVATFKNWAISKSNPNNIFNAIGVDPEDGRGNVDDPLPPDGFYGITEWNHADKWWWLANEVSKAFDENDNKTVVNMYAYGDGEFNALVPKFPLRKNVYPTIIPYLFQKAYIPPVMVNKWATTITGKMGMYDYFNITQYSLGAPQFNIYEMDEKFKYWKLNKIDGMNIESTDAAGPMGHSWWIGGQLEWDLSKNIDTLLNKYVNDCFGAAAPAMKKIYKRWSLNFQGNSEIAFTLRNLKEATDLVAFNSIEWKRINEMKAYWHYIKLIAEHDNSFESMVKIHNYIYRIHDLRMVQTASFLHDNYFVPFNQKPTPVYNPITPSEIETQFQNDYDSVPINYQLSDFVFDYNKVTYTDSIPYKAWRFGGLIAAYFFVAPFTGQIKISAGAQMYAGGDPYPASVNIYSDSTIFVTEKVGANNFEYLDTILDVNFGDRAWRTKDYFINITAGQKYYIRTDGGASRVRIRTPGIVLFTKSGTEDFDNAGYPTKYFYVPIGTTEVVFFDVGAEQPGGGIRDNSGTLLTRMSAGALYTHKVLVPPGQAGKIWSINIYKPQFQLINIPNIQSLQPFSYTE